MHHAHHAPHTVADDSDSGPEDNDIDDKWNNHRPRNNVTDIAARLVTSLPSAGYRILEHRASVSLPTVCLLVLPVRSPPFSHTIFVGRTRLVACGAREARSSYLEREA